MGISTIKALIKEAMEKGVAVYQSWKIEYHHGDLLIFHNGGQCADFDIQGYEKGEMHYHCVCTKQEIPVLSQIELYMLGAL